LHYHTIQVAHRSFQHDDAEKSGEQLG